MGRPNILLIILDSVRTKNMGLYNSGADNTPNIERLSGTATTYHQARAPGSWSLPSHASIFTGSPAHEHGVYGPDRRPDTSRRHIFGQLSSDGYDTGVFSDNPYITRTNNGLQDGFDYIYYTSNVIYPEALLPDKFLSPGQKASISNISRGIMDSKHPFKSVINCVNYFLTSRSPLSRSPKKTTHGSVYKNKFLDWIGEKDQWAACINLMDTHKPFIPDVRVESSIEIDDVSSLDMWSLYRQEHEWWRASCLESAYNDCIRQADKIVGELIAELKRRGEFENTLIILTSDHGECFGEQSRIQPSTRLFFHKGWLSEQLLHVPLVIKNPGQNTARECSQLATLCNIPELISTRINQETGATQLLTTDVERIVDPGFRLSIVESECGKDSHIGQILSSPSVAVYQNEQNKKTVLKKHLRKNSREVTSRVNESGEQYTVESEDSGHITSEIDSVFSESESETLSPDEEYSEDIHEQLEFLGYK
jgi:arylsulfatase